MFKSKWAIFIALMLLLGTVLPAAAAPSGAPAQQASTVTGTCNGTSVSGSQEAVNVALRALGCVYVAPPTPSGVGQSGVCKATTNANLRTGPSTLFPKKAIGATTDQVLTVTGHNAAGTWTNTTLGWIYSPLCENVPSTIETAPRQCNAFTRATDGFNMDTALDKDGVSYDVTILSTLPKNPDGTPNLCWEYRTVQDGAGSSIINDQLPQPPGTRTDAPEWTDWTFLSDDWKPGETAFYSGIAGKIFWDPDKSGPKGLEPVLDTQGRPVQFTENGTQFFDVTPYIGGWMAYQCVVDCEDHWGFRLDHKRWTRQP